MNFDKKDLRILGELDADPRIPLTRLAKRVRLSQQVVDYRLKRLIHDGFITQFGTLFNLATIGYQEYLVVFSLGSLHETVRDRIVIYLQSHSAVFWGAFIGGKWDLLVFIAAKDYNAFDHFLDEVFAAFPKVFIDYEALCILSHEVYRHSFIDHEEKIGKALSINLGGSPKKSSIDALDYAIINRIRSNCRLPSLEIGRTCNVSYKTVQNRIKRLEKNGLIAGYRLFFRAEEIGYHPYLIFISFNSYGRDIEKRLFGYARQHPQITQVYKLFGKWSMVLHVRAKSHQELQGIIVALRTNFPVVGAYEICPIFSDIVIQSFPIPKE